MKAVFISYNQALTERVDMILTHLNIRGYTKWETVYGRGSVNGEPHFGSHTWPSLNSAILTIIEDEKVSPLLEALKNLNEKTEEQGTRAFVWNIEGGM
jgi:nitrogen regulatory protein PII